MRSERYTYNADIVGVLEEQYCLMLARYREGSISSDEQDWMDWANNVLMSATSELLEEVYSS